MNQVEAMLSNKSSENPGFNEMSKLNTYMRKFIYPNDWEKMTCEDKNN